MFYNLENEIAKRKNKSIYRDGDKSLKLYVENYSKADILNEALNQARVEEGTDLNIPKLLEVTQIDGRWGIASEYIEGTPLNVLMDSNPDKMDEYLNMFVDIQLEILSKEVPMLNKIKDKFKRKITETDKLSNGTKYELLQRLDGMKTHTKLCHGDFNPSNIIIKEDGTHYIIDWSHVTAGNASADAARTFLIFSIQGKAELANKYLDLFAKKSGINKGNIQRWIPIVASTQLLKENDEAEEKMLRRWIDVLDYQ